MSFSENRHPLFRDMLQDDPISLAPWQDETGAMKPGKPNTIAAKPP
jgi:hypothetical protein